MSAVTRPRLVPSPSAARIVAVSAVMRSIVEQGSHAARSGASVLLIGETGTGKELLAELVHTASGRPGELVDVNCAALPRDLIEGMLFGHRRGAFSGASEHAEGLVARAARGTLFLDEVTSLAPDAQAKLLRLLETREVRPVGATGKHAVDFRVVAAAQEDLDDRVADRRFRRDLYFRLAGTVLVIPPLRHRPEDIVPLAHSFARQHGLEVTSAAAGVLLRHDWPGNVRELKAAVSRAASATSGHTLGAETFATAIHQMVPRAQAPAPRTIGRPELSEAELVEVCRRCGGDTRLVAQALGVNRATIYRWLRALGISNREFTRERVGL